MTDGILIVALVLAGLVFWRLHQRRAGAGSGLGPTAPDPTTAPPGASIVPLGQFAVAPDKQWLLITPGQ